MINIIYLPRKAFDLGSAGRQAVRAHAQACNQISTGRGFAGIDVGQANFAQRPSRWASSLGRAGWAFAPGVALLRDDLVWAFDRQPAAQASRLAGENQVESNGVFLQTRNRFPAGDPPGG